MNKLKGITLTLATTALVACGPGQKQSNFSSSSMHTTETENLLANLKKVSSKGIMFGHHDDTNYGIGWDGEEGRSDVKSVCGDYPAVISFDLGHIELGDTVSLDNVPFSKIRQEILSQYKRGGMSSLSWHLRNPLTGGDSWDVSDTSRIEIYQFADFIGQHRKRHVIFLTDMLQDSQHVQRLLITSHERSE